MAPLASAIAEDGLQIRLAAEVTGWRIDIHKLSRYQR
jgi:transcription antitermination factor NusA-like protein